MYQCIKIGVININNMFKNKTILITGGTGSFGRAVLERFMGYQFKEIRILSRDEKKQEDLRLIFNSKKIKFFIGDVRDPSSIDSSINGADFIFHAAALKQVPSCEFFPLEAVKTNIIGTQNVIEKGIKHNVKKIITLSTDKAVYPINSMGLSKSLAEKVLISKSRELNSKSTILCATRYGNVLASRGSVIPLFISQIKKRQPITITDPSMTRFLMSLDNSVDLVIHTFLNGNQGDIFVQKSPASTIKDLAIALQKIFNSSSEIKIIGTRHGEKKYESLISREEMINVKDEKKYFRIPLDNRDLNYNKFFNEGELSLIDAEDYNSHNTKRLKVDEIVKLLMDLDYIKSQLNA